ncbi:MAG: hypothetical protein ACUVXI_17660 [bacterium]
MRALVLFVSPLLAQSFEIEFESFDEMRLEVYFERAKGASDEAEWRGMVLEGLEVIRAEWEEEAERGVEEAKAIVLQAHTGDRAFGISHTLADRSAIPISPRTVGGRCGEEDRGGVSQVEGSEG